MGQLVMLLLMLGSLGGILFILRRKIPMLVELPPDQTNIKGQLKQSIQEVVRSGKSRTRMLTSKAEAQAAGLLNKFQQQSEQRNEEFRQSYWDKLRRKTKKK